MYKQQYVDINNGYIFSANDTHMLVPTDSSLFAESKRNGSLIDYIMGVKNNYIDPISTIPIFIMGKSITHPDIAKIILDTDLLIYDEVLKLLGKSDVEGLQKLAWKHLKARLKRYKELIPDKIPNIEDIMTAYDNIDGQISSTGLTVLEALGLIHVASGGIICYGYISDADLDININRSKVWVNYDKIFYASNNKYSLEKYVDVLCGDIRVTSSFENRNGKKLVSITLSQSKELSDKDILLSKIYKTSINTGEISLKERINIADYGFSMGKLMNILTIMNNMQDVWLKHKDVIQWFKWIDYIPSLSESDTKYMFRNIDGQLPNRLISDKATFTMVSDVGLEESPSILIDRNLNDIDLQSISKLARVLYWTRTVSTICTIIGCFTSIIKLATKKSNGKSIPKPIPNDSIEVT